MRVRLREGKEGKISENNGKLLEKYTGHQAFSPVTSCCFEMVVSSFLASFETYVGSWKELVYIILKNKTRHTKQTKQQEKPHTNKHK